jgi:hypothetical protein
MTDYRERAEALWISLTREYGEQQLEMHPAADMIADAMQAVAAEARASAIKECARVADGHRTAMENSGCHREAIGARVARDAIRALLAPRADGGNSHNCKLAAGMDGTCLRCGKRTDDGGE